MAKAPSNASIDALFDRAKSARVIAGPGHPGGELLQVGPAELAALRATLDVVESDERFACMCAGDLVIELRGSWLRSGALSFHHGISLRLKSWCSDARLVRGPALLHFLAARGVEQPLEDYHRAQEQGRQAELGRQAWAAAVPEVLREGLGELESDGSGLPKRLDAASLDAVIDRLRPQGSVAEVLLRWLSAGRGPWSGYASYEALPIRLLERLPVEEVVAAAMGPAATDAMVAAAARFFGDYQMVSSRKSVLAKVPDAFFERARPLVTHPDDRQRHEHAAEVAKHARRPRGAPHATDGGLLVLGESTDGLLGGLNASSDVLVSNDAATLVAFEPDSVGARPMAQAAETFVLIAPRGPVTWTTINLGEIHGRDGLVFREGRRTVELASSDALVAWIVDERKLNREVRVMRRGDAEPTTVRRSGHPWNLCVEGEHVAWTEDAWRSDGAVYHAALGSKPRKMAKIPELGPSMARPRVVIEGSEILIALGHDVVAIGLDGERRTLASSAGVIRAIAASTEHVAMLTSPEEDRDHPWEVWVAPREGGSCRELARFARRPFHRHALVISRRHACFTAGERVLAAPLAP